MKSPTTQRKACADKPISTVVAAASREYLLAVCRYLGTQPYVELAEAARDGQQALDDVERYRPGLVLLDTDMEAMSGLEVAATIRKRYPETRIIILGPEDHPEVRAESRLLGADAFVPKRYLAFAFPTLMSDWFGPRSSIFHTKAEFACV